MALQMGKRPFLETEVHLSMGQLAVFRSETLLHAHVINVDGRHSCQLITPLNFRATAPRQKQGIIFHAVH